MAARGHLVEADATAARILRSTVMKPESAAYVNAIHCVSSSCSLDQAETAGRLARVGRTAALRDTF